MVTVLPLQTLRSWARRASTLAGPFDVRCYEEAQVTGRSTSRHAAHACSALYLHTGFAGKSSREPLPVPQVATVARAPVEKAIRHAPPRVVIDTDSPQQLVEVVQLRHRIDDTLCAALTSVPHDPHERPSHR